MEHSSTFVGIAPDRVFAEFISPDFLRAFSEEVGVVSGDLAVSTTAGVEVAAMPWSFPTNRPGIPSLARTFLPEEVHLDWQQRWGPLRQPPIPATMTVALYGTPSANVTATAQLAARGPDTVYTVLTKTKTSLPRLVAGKVETSIDKELVGWILRVQARVLRRRLGLAEGP